MPTYQYACTECGEELEVVQRFSDDPLTVCPACQGRLRKLFSPVGVVFKGSGFYKTDSRGGSKTGVASGKPKPDADSGSAAKTEAGGGGDSSSTTSESKPSAGSAASDKVA
jgi:putative FmdB family regulatory protein